MRKFRHYTMKSLVPAATKEDGLTLIEVALALVILSIVSLYFLSFFTNSQAQSKFTNQRLSASHLANGVLHEVQAKPFDQLKNNATCRRNSLPEQTRDIYVIDTQICDTNPAYISNPDILYITITTYWGADPAKPGEYRNKVSITGAARKIHAVGGGG